MGMETKNLHNFTIEHLKKSLASSKCQWMGDDLCLVDVTYNEGLQPFRHPCRVDAFIAMFCLRGHIRMTVNLNEFEMTDSTLFLSTPGNILKINEVISPSVEELHYFGIIMSKELATALRVDVNKMFNEGVTMVDNPSMKLSPEETALATKYMELLSKVMTIETNYRSEAVSSLITSVFYLLAGVHARKLKEQNAVVPSSTSRGRQVFENKLFKINIGTFIIANILLICNFIPSGEVFKLILIILESINMGIISFNIWLMAQLKKIK